jgi:DNA-directed RNA polymerase specialized sigma subunit
LHICVVTQYQSLERYDPKYNCAFSSYLHNRIISALLTNLKQLRVVKLPSHISLRDSIIRVSMTGKEVDFDFTEEDLYLNYDLPKSEVTKRKRAPKVPQAKKYPGQLPLAL